MTDELARDVQYLKDRLAVLDVINRHARGCDRHDTDLINSAYWPDGQDEHGTSINAGNKYGQWANNSHTETYVMVVLLAPDEKSVQVMTGRYLDRLERRDGVWRIAVRRSTVDAAFSADASALRNPFFLAQATRGAPGTVHIHRTPVP